MTNLIDALYNQVRSDIRRNARDIARLDNVGDVAGVATTVPTSPLSAAPLALDGQIGYALRFISDGRKSGEGAGSGTGVLAYYNPATNSWLTVREDVVVLV